MQKALPQVKDKIFLTRKQFLKRSLVWVEERTQTQRQVFACKHILSRECHDQCDKSYQNFAILEIFLKDLQGFIFYLSKF